MANIPKICPKCKQFNTIEIMGEKKVVLAVVKQ